MIRLIVGPPCAGKTSYIGAHAKAGDVRLDWDKLAAALDAHASGTHTARDGAVRAVASYGRAVLGHYLRSEWRGIRDDGSEATAWIPVTRPAAVGGLEPYVMAGARVTLVNPGEAECLRRCEQDNRPEGTAESIREWFANPPEIPDAWLYQEETDQKGGRLMRSYSAALHVKAASGEHTENPFGGHLEEGDFIAYASTFHNDPDSYGDIVEKGAFAGTLKKWDEGPAPIPLLYGHNMHDPAYNIGHIVEAREDETGLLVWGRIDLETEKGAQTYRLVKSRRINQLSFAFDVLNAEEIKDEKGEPTGGLLLKELELHEVSLVQLGANRHTSVLAVKSAAEQVAATRGDFTEEETADLRDAAEALREALARLEKLLAGADENPDEENENNTDDTGTEDAREPAEPAEPVKDSSSASKAAACLALAIAL